MKDSVIAAFEVAILVAALAVAFPRGKGRAPAASAESPAQYASMLSLATPAPAAAVAATPSAATLAPAPQPVAAAKAAPAPAAPVAAPAPVAAAKQAAPAGKEFWGVIDSIDPAARTLVLKDKRGNPHTLKLAAQVAVTRGGENEPSSVEKLKAEDPIMARVEDGQVRDIHIRLLFPAPAGSTAQN